MVSRSSGRRGREVPPPLPPEPAPAPPPESGRVRRWLHEALVDNLGLKFVSMVLAVTVFLLVNDDKDREITVPVGVQYVLPEDRVLVSERVDEVRVTIRGPWRRMRNFDERELPRINVDLRSLPSGEIAFTTDMVEVPSGLTVAGVTPRTMRVAFDRRAEKLVEVAPAIAGRPQHGYVVVEVKAQPATVKVRGGERLLAALSSVRTQEVSLEGRTESFVAPTTLVPPDGIELVGSEQVTMQVDIDEALVTRLVRGVGISIRGEPGVEARWAVTPQQVDVTLTGALLELEKAKATMTPVVRVTPSERAAREAELVIEGLPPGVGVRLSPERVKITPIAPTGRPAGSQPRP